MTITKQIQVKFWQDDFVLELKPEERYFYMYLITNTTSTACGIYKFNHKLAVLETGLSAEAINEHLNTFESLGKIIISKSKKEIMLVNWLKHNCKMNKKTIKIINSELKEVKDKELLSRFLEVCKFRQYPVEEIFNGIIVASEVKEEAKESGQATSEEPKQHCAKPEQEEVNAEKELEDKKSIQAEGSETAAKDTSQVLFFNTVKEESTACKRKRKARGKRSEQVENIEAIDVEFSDGEDPEAAAGIPIATWSFADSSEAVCSS